MKALDIVAKHIREVAQQLTAKFGADLKALRDHVDQRFSLESSARELSERRYELELSEVRKSVSSNVEALTKDLEREKARIADSVERTKAFEGRFEAHEDLTSKCQALESEISALRKDLDVQDEIKALEDLLIEERQKRLEEAATLKSTLEAQAKAANDAFEQASQQHKTEIEALRKELDVKAEMKALEAAITKRGDEQKSLEAQFASFSTEESQSRAALDKKQAEEIQSLRMGFEQQIKTLQDQLTKSEARNAEKAEALAALVEQSSKTAEESIQALGQTHATEIAALREAVDDKTPLTDLEKQLASLRTDVSEAQKSAETVASEIRLSIERDEAISKIVAETVDLQEQHDAALKSLAEALKAIPEAPEIPKELAELPSSLAEVIKKLELLEQLSKGFMHFRGTWDEAEEYKEGATVACKNSLWVAIEDRPSAAPGERNSGWKMCIKSGKLVTPYETR